jgi:hypothetical protein
MAFKPNFTGVHRDGEAVIVSGTSDADSVDDIVDIRVVLAQGDRVQRAVVDTIGADWNTGVPGDGFAAGPATAFGIETRRENATTITWAQPVDIP